MGSAVGGNQPGGERTRRTLCLTPECYKLWAIRPGLCFLYDVIIIDSRDYDDVLASAEKSSYNWILARNVERLRMEGILQIRSYDPLLPEVVRKSIHDQASRYIESLGAKRRFDLALYAHREYEEYLRGQILFCRTDEPKFSHLTERLARIRNRITTLCVQERPTAETDETLKRIAAKSLAGSHVVSAFGGAHLYDTSEYRPFISGIPVGADLLEAAGAHLHDQAEDKAVDLIAAVVLNKSLPDVTVYDDHSLTMFLSTREELARLRDVVEEVLERYHDLILADPEAAKSHLQQRFLDAVRHLERELEKAAKKAGLLWKVTEILASIKFSLLKPFLKPLSDANMKIHRQMQIENLATEDKLLADLLFVFDQVRFGEKRYDVAPDRVFEESKTPRTTIWGQQDDELPWYERAE